MGAASDSKAWSLRCSMFKMSDSALSSACVGDICEWPRFETLFCIFCNTASQPGTKRAKPVHSKVPGRSRNEDRRKQSHVSCPLPDRATARACAGPLHLPRACVCNVDTTFKFGEKAWEKATWSRAIVVKLQAEEASRAPGSPWP